MIRATRRLAFGLIAAAFVTSATGCYFTRAAWEDARILSGRRPITEAIRDRAVSPETRAKLRIVLAARDYARDSLDLDVGGSFASFTQLDRDTLVLVVSAAERDWLRAYTWRFPIVGRVPYKGYFDFSEARREAAGLERRGYDVYLRPADAYSTLGWFDDPLLSTTLARDSLNLVETVIHEVTHNTFYAPGHASFNESFAEFVGSRGAAAFFRHRSDSGAAGQVELRWADAKLLAAFWADLAAELDSAFARRAHDRAARLAVRDTIYARARSRLVNDIAPMLRTIDRRYAERVPLDNASLLARQVYGRGLDVFDAVWELEQRDLRRTIRRVIALANAERADPLAAVRQWVRAATPTP